MGEVTEKVVVQIEISDADAEKKMIALKGRAQEYKDENVKLNSELKKLSEQNKSNTTEFFNLEKTMRQNEVQIKSLSAEARIYERILVSSQSAQRAADGSMVQNMATLSELSARYKLLTAEQRDNTEEGKQLQKQISDITATLKKQEEALGDNRRSVGNYALAFEGLKGKLEELKNINLQVNQEGFAKSEKEVSDLKVQIFEMGKAAISSASSIGELQQVVKTFADASIQATGEVKDQLSQIAKDAKAKIDEVNQSLKEVTQKTEEHTGKLEDFAKGFVAAFTIDRVISTLNDSAEAFMNAEDNARKLQSAVSSQGGLQSDFDALIQQSKTLQDSSIFADDDIQRVQTFALNAGLTTQQVQKLIPVVADFASRNSLDLATAMDKVIGGMNGQQKALNDYGVVVDVTKDRIGRLADITETLNAKYRGGARDIAETAAGAVKVYQNQVDDLMENVGSKYLPVLQTFKIGLLAIARDLTDIFTGDFFKSEGMVAEIDRVRERTASYATTLSDAALQAKALEISIGVTQLQKQRDSVEASSAAYKNYSSSLNSALGLLQAYNAELANRNSEKDAAAEKAQAQKDLTTLTIKELQARKAEEEKLNTATSLDAIDKIDLELERRKKLEEEKSKLTAKAVEDYKKAADSLRGIAEKNKDELLKTAAQTEEEKLALQKAAEQKEVEEAYSHTDKLKVAQQLRKDALASIDEKYKLLNDAALQKGFEDAAAELDKYLDEEIQKLDLQEQKKNVAKEEAKNLEQTFLQDDYQKQLTELDAYYEQVLFNTELSEEKRAEIIRAIGIKRNQVQEEIFANDVQQFGNLFNSLSQLSRKGSAEQKVFAISATTIDTYVGAQKAFNSQFVPGDPTSLIRAILAASAATIGGLARVKQIMETKGFYDGGFTEPGNPHEVSPTHSNARRTIHKSEYVAPARIVATPAGAALVNQLEAMRVGVYGPGTGHRAQGMFETGGFVPASLSSGGVANVTVKGISAEEVQNVVRETMRSMPAPVVVVEDINDAQFSVAQVAERANY